MNTDNAYGDYTVKKDETVCGTRYGAVTVTSGVTFINEGIIHGAITLEEGAVLHNLGCIHGAMSGEGYAEISGTYHGVISLPHYRIFANSLINGNMCEEDETV